ncbi:MAG TPA: HAD family hydrolase [Verrucomicrobiae bacterium]|nr:HAD family hydrolase [Verrucomicrobiae bacterium]
MENLRLTSKPPIGLRLAVWSGPRNVSTAFMRSWGNRDDTYVCDEPLYAHYLLKTGRPHPMAAEVIASQENDWRKVTAWLTGPIPEGKSVFFQKHMAHHLLPEIGRDWLLRLTHLFLIRHPREVVPSLDEKFHQARLPDTGYPQQVEIFNLIREQTGAACPVVDAADLLREPRQVLIRLCEIFGASFQESMLHWAPGLRPTDGVWARHWYNAVETTTGFRPYTSRPKPLPERLLGLYEQCLPYYQSLSAFCVKP